MTPNPISVNIKSIEYLDTILQTAWLLLLNHLVLLFTLFEYGQYHLQVKADIEHLLGSSIVFEQFWEEQNNLLKTCF